MTPKVGLPEGAKRLIRECASDATRPLHGGDLNVAKVLAARGYLELLPGCSASSASFASTDLGRRMAGLE